MERYSRTILAEQVLCDSVTASGQEAQVTDIRQIELDDLTAEQVRAFLSDAPPEAINLEYKREVNDRTVETIAAMANTYGGTLIIGFSDAGDTPSSTIVGVRAADVDALVNKCLHLLQPPFAPTLKQFTIDDRLILVVRVVPDEAEQPVVVRGSVKVRSEGRNAPATRFQILDLSRRRGIDSDPITSTNYLHSRIQHPRPEAGQAFLRLLTGLVLPRYPIGDQVIDDPMRRQALAALQQGRFTELLVRWLDRRQTGAMRWSLDGPAHTTAATLLAGHPDTDPTHARCHLRLPDPVMPAGQATIAIDVFSRATGNAVWSLEDLYFLVDAVAEAVFAGLVPLVAEQLTGTPHLRNIGAHVTIETGDQLLPALGLDGVATIPGASSTSGATLRSHPSTNLADKAVRHDQIVQWLHHTLLNAAVATPNEVLARLQA